MPVAMAIQRFGLGNLRSEHRPPEQLGEGLVRVAIKAVSLNHRDVLVIRGTYGPGLNLPLIPCSDAAGVVVAVGSGVSGLSPGDRVCTQMVPDWHDGRLEPRMRTSTLGGPADGVLCEERVLPQAAVLPIPATVSFEQAACLPVAGLAAWSALKTEAAVGPGSRVLLLGTGGVSVMALQIAKCLGAQVAVTSSSDEKLTRIRALGADLATNYRTEPWVEKVREWSGGGVDLVLEVGGDGTLDQSVTATRDGGCIAVLGVLAQRTQPVKLPEILMRRIRVQGIFVGSRVELERYLAFVEANRIEPVVDRVFEGLSMARAAFAYLITRRHVGKILVRVSSR